MDYTSSYMKVLEESLLKKSGVLQALLEASHRQEALAEAEDFDMDTFTDTMEQKDALLEQLKELDEGFERTYEGVQQELNTHREQYADAIQRIQELIRRVTALGVELQTLEERNRAKLEIKFSKQQRELRQIKTSNKVATTYYKNMSNAPASAPYFMDQKK